MRCSSSVCVSAAFLAGPTMWSPRRQEGDTKIIGRAYTVQYALLDDPAPKVPNHYVSQEASVVLLLAEVLDR